LPHGTTSAHRPPARPGRDVTSERRQLSMSGPERPSYVCTSVTSEPYPKLEPGVRTDAPRHAAPVRGDARRGRPGRLRVSGHQRHVLRDAERRAARIRASQCGWNRSALGGRCRVPIRDGSAGRAPGCTRVRGLCPRDRRGEPRSHRPSHRPHPAIARRRLATPTAGRIRAARRPRRRPPVSLAYVRRLDASAR
jgi:hypothetical protein